MRVDAGEAAQSCPVCGRAMRVQKTWERTGMTLGHGSFRIRQTVRVCPSGCRKRGVPVGGESPLAGIIPPRGVAGYDVMVHAGLERFLHHRQREEIRAALAAEHGIVISSGEISVLSARFLACLERLHQAAGPGLRAALASDGGWPLHIGATGEDGRGTLLAAFAGWRQWMLGAWKAPTWSFYISGQQRGGRVGQAVSPARRALDHGQPSRTLASPARTGFHSM